MGNNDLELSKQQSGEIVSSIVLQGDLSKLSPQQKVEYYREFCLSLGLNPLTMPFNLLKMQNREVLYANKNCAEQLRKNHNVSVLEITQQIVNDIMVVNVKVQDGAGRIDVETGAVSVIGLKGEQLANAMMKAVTKAKRRATLSICSVGVMDESEIESIPESEKVVMPIMTGEQQPSSSVPKFATHTEPATANQSTPTPEKTKQSKLTDSVRGQILDMGNEMITQKYIGWSQKRLDMKIQKGELLGDFAVMDEMSKEYQAFLDCMSKAALKQPIEEIKFQ